MGGHYLNKYASAFEHFAAAGGQAVPGQRSGGGHSRLRGNASSLHTMEELRQWRDAQEAVIHKYFPARRVSFLDEALKREFDENEKRIAKKTSKAEGEDSERHDDVRGLAEGGEPDPTTNKVLNFMFAR